MHNETIFAGTQMNLTGEAFTLLDHWVQVEAAALNHEFVGTEHVLLALEHLPTSEALAIYPMLGLSAAVVRRSVLDMVWPNGEPLLELVRQPFTPRAKFVLSEASNFAGPISISTGHILKALILEAHGVVATFLTKAQVTMARIDAALVTNKHWREQLAHRERIEPFVRQHSLLEELVRTTGCPNSSEALLVALGAIRIQQNS